MRKIVFGGATSLDNYLARPDHSADWLMWGKEAAAITSEFWKTIDTVLMGRKTFEAASRSGQGTGYAGVRNYVFSRTLPDPGPGGVTIVRDDAEGFVRIAKRVMPRRQVEVDQALEAALRTLHARLTR